MMKGEVNCNVFYLDDDKSTVMFMYLDYDGCSVLYCTEMEKGSTDLAGY